jgi:two-component system sensor histidine kinase BaeS
LVGETERLDAFVGDLLELARLEADDFTISPEPVDVAVMLEQTRETWSGRAATIDVALTAQASPGLRVVSDARRVRQLLDGLVENALRVSPAGSTIALSAADRGSAVEIAVADAGPGLVGDDRSTAFERGVLRDRYRDIRPVGTGLGLSIASRLANRLGGDIRVGDSPGGGATFVVALPADTIAR